MKESGTLWQCRCGKRMRMSAEQITSGTQQCPNCGVVVDHSSGFEYNPSADDTQMVNIDEMARMAQEGIDVTISGEWDTSFEGKPRRKPTEED